MWATSAETESLRLRPSLYVSRDVKAGDVVSNDNVRSVRPSGGLPPSELPLVIGRHFARAVAVGTPVSWDLFAS